MKPMTVGKLRRLIKAAAAAFLTLSLAMPSVAKENRKGAVVLVQKKDGQVVKAELLAVKAGQLILMDSSTFSDVTCDVDDIRSIRVVKKAKVWKGLGLGILTGGAAGSSLGLLSGNDKPGLFSPPAGLKALIYGVGLAAIGGIIGGISGALAGIDESVELEGRSSRDIESILSKLDKQAHFPQRLHQDSSRPIPVSTKEEIKYEQTPDLSSARAAGHAISASQDPGRAKFKRFHFSYRPGYSRSQAAHRCVCLFKDIGFGDTKPAHDVSFFGFSFFTTPATEFPKVSEKRNVMYGDARADYSITRKFAVGIGYSSLGESEVQGYRFIPIERGGRSYYTELFLNANLSGDLYYFMVSWMPLPDVFLRKTSFALGVGAGWCRLNLQYMTLKSSSKSNDQMSLSEGSIALIGLAEFDYFFSESLSLGINVEYRYAPVNVSSFSLQGVYYDLDENLNLIERVSTVTIPEHRVNSGGFRFGMSIGLHL